MGKMVTEVVEGDEMIDSLNPKYDNAKQLCYVTDDEGNKIEVLGLADSCINDWEKFFSDNNL